MNENTMPAARRLAVGAAGVSAAIAVVAGIAHGFGKDDETMYRALHIAVGHLLPVLVAAGTLVWLTALHAAARTKGTADLLWLSAAQVGICLWAGFTTVHSLGLYIFAQVDPVLAAKTEGPALAKVYFIVSTISVLIGLAGCLQRVVRRQQVPVVAAVLVVLGTPAAFFAGPVGDFVLAIALGWAAIHAATVRQTTPSTVLATSGA